MEDSKFWMRLKDWDGDARHISIQIPQSGSVHPEGDMKSLVSREHEWYMGVGDDYYYKRLKIKRRL